MNAEQPTIVTQVSITKDKKYVIHTTKIITIRPTAYYEAIVADNIRVRESTLTQEQIDELLGGNK